MRLTKQRHIAILYNYHTSLINTTLTSSQRSKQDQILPSQTCNISIFMSTFFFSENKAVKELNMRMMILMLCCRKFWMMIINPSAHM